MKKIQNSHFWLFQIYTSLFVPKRFDKFRMHIFGFLYFWERWSEEIQNGHFWPFQFYCYIVGLGLNCKFIDLLFKCSVIKFIKISSHLDFIVFKNYLQSDRHTHSKTDVLEIILIRNLLMVNHTVVIASVAACLT